MIPIYYQSLKDLLRDAPAETQIYLSDTVQNRSVPGYPIARHIHEIRVQSILDLDANGHPAANPTVGVWLYRIGISETMMTVDNRTVAMIAARQELRANVERYINDYAKLLTVRDALIPMDESHAMRGELPDGIEAPGPFPDR